MLTFGFNCFNFSFTCLIFKLNFHISHLGTPFVFFLSFWLCWVFGLLIAVCELSPVAVGGGHCPAAECGLLTAVASLVTEHRLESSQASVAAAHEPWALECGLSSCGAWPSFPPGMWDPGPGVEPLSPAL